MHGAKLNVLPALFQLYVTNYRLRGRNLARLYRAGYLCSMLLFIQQPFPFSRGLKKEILHVCVLGLFASLIFYFLKPFGLSTINETYLLGYGLVSISAAIIFLIVSHRFYYFFTRHRNWTIGHEIIHSLFFLMFIATSILVYGYAVNISRLRVQDFFLYQFYTILTGIVPVTIRAILLRNWRLKKDLQEATEMNEWLSKRKISADEKMIRLQSPSSAQTLKISNQALLYLEAAQNYTIIVWSDEGTIRKEMMRLAMKEAYRQINDTLVVFCHRSYMVNLRKVKKIIHHSGNPELALQDGSIMIPLSATYKKDIKEKLMKRS
jgi:hypothetical protein